VQMVSEMTRVHDSGRAGSGHPSILQNNAPVLAAPANTTHTQVRAKYTTKSPTDCVPPGCEVQGVLDLGVNPFTLTQTGVSLLTDPESCASAGTLYAILVRLMSKGRGADKSTVETILEMLLYTFILPYIRMTHHVQGANVYSFTAPSTGCFSFSTCNQICT